MAGVLRFAPSPNGRLHLGHAFSALLNQAIARRMHAELLLRVEDIDPVRSRPEHVAAILEDLRWLGFEWDGEVRYQSRHMEDYGAALAELKGGGFVYPCFCSRAQIAAATRHPGHPRDPDDAPVYPGTCRDMDPADSAARIKAGEPHVLRLDMKRALAGIGRALDWEEWNGADHTTRIAADPGAWGDVVIARRDVATSYHLAVVTDDAAQEITHVVRGRDLYHATAVHRVLQELLHLPGPVYHHHRLLLDEDGRKLAKSAGATSIADLRAAGVRRDDILARLGSDFAPSR